MGVKGLWQLLEPVGRPVTLESLEGKVLSVDASILLNQAVKGMRDKTGNPLPNAHLVVLFNRLCKLLFYRIKPIFVFDGGVPILKKKTLAVRRERKFKAKHGSNKATEKLVKNYLKGKALETVTGRKSAKTIFRNNSPRDPDIFELPPISLNQETVQESSSSEEEDDDGLQPFYSQHDFEKKFQDPSSINVNSQDFLSLPEEIQHELIKEVMEEKKWTTIQSMPQDAFGFSDYQLQNVLQRGKLHQRLDELRKQMNNRNTGEVSGLSSQQDSLGADSSVLSQRIVSEDSGHFVLIKTSKDDSNENRDSPMIDSLTEGGFLREDQEAPPRQAKPTIHSRVPSFDLALTCNAASSDSEPDVPLLDVPEVVILDLDEPHKKRERDFDQKEERESHAKIRDGGREVMVKGGLENQRGGKFDMKEGREINAKAEKGRSEVMVNYTLQGQSGDVLGKNNAEIAQMEKNKLDSDSEDNISDKEVTMGGAQDRLKLNIDESDEESESIEAQIERRRNQIEMLLSKRQPTGNLLTRENACEKNIQENELATNTTAGEDGSSVLPADDETVEFRLYIESSSDDDEEGNEGKIPSQDHEGMDNEDGRRDVEVIEEKEHSGQENATVPSRDEEAMGNKATMEDIEVMEDTRHDNLENTTVPSRDDEAIGKKGTMEDVEVMEDNHENAIVPSRNHEVVSGKDRIEEVKGIEDTQRSDQEDITDKEDLEKHSSDITDQKEEVQVLDNQQEELTEKASEEEEAMEVEEVSHKEEVLAPVEKPTEQETRFVPAPSEFAGTTKEDLEVMQVNLEMEQQSLQTERARQERMAATVSNEMLTESQELLRLFGVPYLVSPMEAEAQCAFLDFTDQTSGTITDDSDVFLFGGTRVYKNIFNQNKHAELYTIDAITGHLALDRSKMINLAFITGSDYTEGIQGLGAVGAMEVLHEFDSEGFEALIKFKKWHEETKNNKNSAQETHVKQKLRRISLPSGFPSQEVFDSYISPVIDESRDAFEWGKPDLHGLRLFAKEKLGWSAAKTDENLLPVLKQLNNHEHQMKMEDFFQIKFHEPRKKPSRRVRRVVNRFLNPLSSSDSSSSDDEGKTSSGSQMSSMKGREKETGSRKMAASRVTRGIGRGRGQSRGRRSTAKAGKAEHRSSSRDINDRSVASTEQVESVAIISDGNGGEEGCGSTSVDRKPKKEGRKTGKRNMVGKGKIVNQELHIEGKDKHNFNVRGVKEDQKKLKSSKPQDDHNDKNDQPNNLINENNVSVLQRNNAKNQRYKIPKKASKAPKDESGSSGLGNNDDSSTSSDSDSDDARFNWPSSGNLTRTNKHGGRGAGRKRTRGRGRGRGGVLKRTKLEKKS